MMNKKSKKLHLLFITILLMTFLNLTNINASEGGGDGETFMQSSANYEVSDGDGAGGGAGGGGNCCIVESCQSGVDFKPWSKVYIKMKDMHGNEIPVDSIKKSKIQTNFLAGTYINQIIILSIVDIIITLLSILMYESEYEVCKALIYNKLEEEKKNDYFNF